MSEIFAVIDTETNYENELISVGMVMVDSKSFEIQDEYYGIIDPAYKSPSMYENVLRYKSVKVDKISECKEIFEDLERNISTYKIARLFAYNANFDYRHLKCLQRFQWYDIMKIAAYRQYNEKITKDFACCKTGRLKCNYNVTDMYRLLSGKYDYHEVHNALEDARDELGIMRMLGKSLDMYEDAKI